MSITVTTHSGDVHILEGREGLSLMEIIKSEGIDELLALCGGCLSCATCHVYVETSDKISLPAMSPDESDLLDSSSQRRDGSRLSCQIPYHPSLDGLRVQIAAVD